MKLARATILLLALAGVTAAQDATPGARVIERAKADCDRIFPQTVLGGDPDAKLPRPGDKEADFSDFKVDVEGLREMTAFTYVPKSLKSGHRYPLMFTFHGNGESGRGNVHNLGPLLLGADPCLVCGLQYQKLEDNGKPKFNNPMLGSYDDVYKAARWLLSKMQKDYAIDAERVFVGGFSMGTSYSSAWACHEWQKDPDVYPFRALFLFSSPGMTQRDSMPPTPTICTVGEDERKVLGTIDVVAAVHRYCNALLSWGLPCQYHEVPKMGHSVNGRCVCICRDVINQLGGPGLQWSSGAQPDPLPFKSEDPLVQQVIALCAADDWAGARARLDEIARDKKLKSKDKKPAKDFERELDKFAKDEVARLQKEVDKALKAEKLPPPHQAKRLRALAVAYSDAIWLKGKDALAGLRKTEAEDYPPAAREAARRKLMADAMAAEQSDNGRADAKKLYEQLAARKDEDSGMSIWPKAAQYRLSWWIDG